MNPKDELSDEELARLKEATEKWDPYSPTHAGEAMNAVDALIARLERAEQQKDFALAAVNGAVDRAYEASNAIAAMWMQTAEKKAELLDAAISCLAKAPKVEKPAKPFNEEFAHEDWLLDIVEYDAWYNSPTRLALIGESK